MSVPSEKSLPSSASSGSLAWAVERLTDRVQAGEHLDADTVALEYSRHAEELRGLLPALQALADLERSKSQPSTVSPPEGELLGELGDFRLIREVGRGGMGVVYEAEQISLGRRVALKVLPFAATMDPRQLQRFHNEARAAASLEHPHIVPVYGVGSERSVHFYAMKFIDGYTLADLVARQNGKSTNEPTTAYATADAPTPPPAATQPEPRDSAYFRRVAEWGVQAAQALEHAHTLGVVHRDIKPANLMIDTVGKLWVADFGLARTATGDNLTMSGDMLGTLRYMSPEQALAKHGLVDHRTDIYALGVTLYELLTARPAVSGQDRAHILHAIAFEESPLLRSLDTSIAPDLETVVLKGIDKDPTRRYATAREMADDLKRWLEHQPIMARRPSLADRVTKWTRRHRGLVATAFLVLIVSVLALGVSTALIADEQGRTRQASETKDIALVEKEEALKQLTIRTNEKEAERAAAVLVMRESLTLARRQLAIGESLAGSGKYTEAIQIYQGVQNLLEAVQARFPVEAPDLKATWLENGLPRFAKWLRQVGDVHRAEKAYRVLAGHHEELLKSAAERLVADKADFEHERNATHCIDLLQNEYANWADLLVEAGDLAEAESVHRKHLEMLQRWEALLPGKGLWEPTDIAEVETDLAWVVLELGRLDEAEGLFRKTIQRYGKQKTFDLFEQGLLASSLNGLGDVQRERGQPEAAAASYKEALGHLEALAKSAWAEYYRYPLAQMLADCPHKPLRDLPRALQLAQKLTEESPADARFHLLRALAAFRAGRWEEASAEAAVVGRAEWKDPLDRWAIDGDQHPSGTLETRSKGTLGAEAYLIGRAAEAILAPRIDVRGAPRRGSEKRWTEGDWQALAETDVCLAALSTPSPLMLVGLYTAASVPYQVNKLAVSDDGVNAWLKQHRPRCDRLNRLRAEVAATLGHAGPPTVAISDATAIEGSGTLKILDRFVADKSGGLATPRASRFGPDGNGDSAQDLYVVSKNTNQILRYDGRTGAFLDVFVTSSSGLNSPVDLAFGPDGKLYVSNGKSGEVLRFNGTTGAFVDRIASGLSTPQGLTFGADGSLYIAVSGTDEVLRYKGTELSVFVSAGSGGLDVPLHAVFGPDGNLYVVSNATRQVLRYDGLTGAFLNVFASTAVPGVAGLPQHLEFGADAYLYVSARNNTVDFKTSVVRFNATTGAFVDSFNTGHDGASFNIGSDGILYLSGNGGGNYVDRLGASSLAAFTVSLSSASAVPVTVNYSTANGTATAGSDYTAVSGTLTFAPGETSRTILVQTVDDASIELTETFTVNLSNPVGATITDGQGVGTILDTDTKFYVVDDATANKTFEYGSTGAAGENYALNSGNTAPRGAASTAAGTTVWVVDVNKNVYVCNVSGTLLGSWTAGGLNANAQVEGIATNGTDIWLVDAKQDKVFKYTGAATRLSGSQNAASSFSLNSGNADPKDIVTDGTSLWIVNDSSANKVFKYSLSGTLAGSWTIDAANATPTGITLNPSDVSTLWIVDSGTDKIYEYANAASRISGSLSASTSYALAAGNSNPQGIADPPVSQEALASVQQMEQNEDNLNNWSLTTVQVAGSPLLGGGSPVSGDTANSALTNAHLQPIVAAAIARWEVAGLGAEQLAAMRGVGTGMLSMHTPDGIWIDDDAAGWGWFVDPTPHDHSEFTKPGNQGEQNRMDLLTAVMHEVGHVLGHDHEDGGVMQEVLPAGTRWLPSEDAVVENQGQSASLAARDCLFAAAHEWDAVLISILTQPSRRP